MLDPTVGIWMTEDPIGFDGGDPNLRRYVGNNATNGVDRSGLADTYRTNFFKELAELLKSSNELRAAQSFYTLHHSVPQFLEPLFRGTVVNIHAPGMLMMMHPTIAKELDAIQQTWLQQEMQKINPKWTFSVPAHREAFLKAVAKDEKFPGRVLAFAVDQTKEMKGMYISVHSTADEIAQIYKRFDGAQQLMSEATGMAKKAVRLLPKVAGAIAIFALLQPTFALAGGHNPEQAEAFQKFHTRYQNLYKAALQGQAPDKLQQELLIKDIYGYFHSIKVDDVSLGVFHKSIGVYTSDK